MASHLVGSLITCSEGCVGPGLSLAWTAWLRLRCGGFLVRILVLVGVSRGSAEPFFRVPGRGGHLGVPATKWAGRGRPAGHAAVPPAVSRWPFPLARLRGPFFSRGVPSEISG